VYICHEQRNKMSSTPDLVTRNWFWFRTLLPATGKQLHCSLFTKRRGQQFSVNRL